MGRGVCHHSQLIDVASKTRWSNATPSAIMAAKSHIQTAAWPYGRVQVSLIRVVPTGNFSIAKALTRHERNMVCWVFPTAALRAGPVQRGSV